MNRSRRFALPLFCLAAMLAAQQQDATSPLPGTQRLDDQSDLAMKMVGLIDAYLTQRLADSAGRRMRPAPEARERLRHLLGVVDSRVPFDSPSIESSLLSGPVVGEGEGFEILAVRWPVLNGPNLSAIDGEGLLLRPRNGSPRAAIVALPDAGWTPEQLAGLEPGVAAEAQFARRLAEAGCLVLVPQLIDRSDSYSGNPAIRFTNQPHREYIHRMAYEMGRHIVGYEVQKVLAAVDWFGKMDPALRVGVYGYGEGGLLALMAAALDGRIHATAVAGYFQKRENVVWSEPIYRNIWSQLEQFGDAEVAGLIAPRFLLIENSPHPRVDGPPPERDGRRGAASGRIAANADPVSVRSEVERARRYHSNLQMVDGGPGGEAALGLFLRELGVATGLARPSPVTRRSIVVPRMERQVKQMVDYTQRLMLVSEHRRKQFMAKMDVTSPGRITATAADYRRQFWEDSQGRMPPATEPLSAVKSRPYIDKPAYRGYEVVIPVWGEVFAYGILLVPKDLQPGERRPVVVCQHGLEGRPQHLIDPSDERTAQIYARFAAALAERGFIVFAPQNPYIGMEKFRILMRKANPVKLSLYSFIIGQHSRIIDWLETLAFVDKSRIGFYGLSYGGKTAMRVPAIETRYALSICSGDFNEWTWKVVSTDFPFSYMFTQEYDMLEFNLGHTFAYYEQAMMIAPRPFMVERGHRDGVGIDEWVSLEFAKVRRLYNQMGQGAKAEIEYFDGPHQIHGAGTYDFLHRHLAWPVRR